MTPQREALNKLIAMAAADDALGAGDSAGDNPNAADLLGHIARAALVSGAFLAGEDTAATAHQRLADLVETILYVVGDIYGIEWKADNDG